MATNQNNGGSRKGAIKDRTQFQNPITKRWQKRGPDGRIMDVKTSDFDPFKSVSKEK